MRFPLSFQINVGQNNNNPILTIPDSKLASQTVTQFIKLHALPSTYYPLIMQKISPFLQPSTPKSPIKLNCFQSNIKQTTIPLSPLRTNNTSFTKTTKSRSPKPKQQKQNNKNFTNVVQQSKSIYSKISLSPSNKINSTKSKIEYKPQTPKIINKSTIILSNKDNKQPKKHNNETKIRELFKNLTKNNPTGVKILSPDHINLRGLERNILQNLQDFLQLLEQDQFDLMTEEYFVKRIQKMEFTLKLCPSHKN